MNIIADKCLKFRLLYMGTPCLNNHTIKRLNKEKALWGILVKYCEKYLEIALTPLPDIDNFPG